MKVCFVGSCIAKLYSIYFSYLNRAEEVKFICAFKDDSRMSLKIRNTFCFNRLSDICGESLVNEINIYNNEASEEFLSSCDKVFFQRFGFRPNIPSWEGADCDDISDPNQLHFSPEKVSSLLGSPNKITEISRMFYSSTEPLAYKETLSLEEKYSPKIKCSKIIEQNKEALDAHEYCRWNTHLIPEVYLQVMNLICDDLNVSRLSEKELADLSRENIFKHDKYYRKDTYK